MNNCCTKVVGRCRLKTKIKTLTKTRCFQKRRNALQINDLQGVLAFYTEGVQKTTPIIKKAFPTRCCEKGYC
jgi:hypothetical protein